MSEAHYLEQLAEVQAAQRALALEVENSRSAHQRELEGLAASALELTEALQQLSDDKAEPRSRAFRDLAAARRQSSELHMELLLAQADADGDRQDAKQVDEGLERRKLQALEDLKMAKEEVQVYEDCCQQLRSELRAAQVFICFHSVPSAHVAPVLRREFYASGATGWANVIKEAVDEDGDHVIISECGPTTRPPDFAECRHAAARLKLPFHFNDPSGGCHLSSNVVSYGSTSGLAEATSRPLCVSHSLRMNLRIDSEQITVQGEGLKIFCFAWTTWKPQDVALLREVRHAFKQCDGYRIFSDRQPFAGQEADVVAVRVSQQHRDREDEKWLYHRNMVGLMPSWSHLLQEDVAGNYDWLVNVEFDHFLLTQKLRRSIASYLSLLQQGHPEQRQAAEGPLMLMFGNAFLFNRMMVSEMKRQWHLLGETAPSGHEASGCPIFMQDRFEWPLACSQDIAYPNLVTVMNPQVPAYGSPGCGQKPEDDFPLACFELQRQPVQELGLDQLGLVRTLAASFSNRSGAAVLLTAQEVPLFHHLSDPSARKLARELLEFAAASRPVPLMSGATCHPRVARAATLAQATSCGVARCLLHRVFNKARALRHYADVATLSPLKIQKGSRLHRHQDKTTFDPTFLLGLLPAAYEEAMEQLVGPSGVGPSSWTSALMDMERNRVSGRFSLELWRFYESFQEPISLRTGTFSSQARRSSVRRQDLRVTLSGHYRLREVPALALSGFIEDGLNQCIELQQSISFLKFQQNTASQYAPSLCQLVHLSAFVPPLGAMAADFILDTVAVCFAVFFMTAPLSQAIDVCGTPAKVRYVNPINLLCFSLNCITQLAYGLFLPVPPVVPCNAYGVFVGVFSTSACWCFARKEPHANHWDRTAAFATAFTVLLAAVIFAYAALGGAADVGVLGMMVGIIMYGAPLSSMKEVLRTKSSEMLGRDKPSWERVLTLPVMQSFLGFLNSSCWFTVGVRTGKVPVWGPNIIGMMLSLLQLALIFKFPAKPTGDLEDDEFVPLLAEHSLADIARDTSREWKEAIVDHSHSISLFMKKSSQDRTWLVCSLTLRAGTTSTFPWTETLALLEKTLVSPELWSTGKSDCHRDMHRWTPDREQEEVQRLRGASSSMIARADPRQEKWYLLLLPDCGWVGEEVFALETGITVSDRPTWWSEDGRYFIYYAQDYQHWKVNGLRSAGGDGISSVRPGRRRAGCGFAHSSTVKASAPPMDFSALFEAGGWFEVDDDEWVSVKPSLLSKTASSFRFVAETAQTQESAKVDETSTTGQAVGRRVFCGLRCKEALLLFLPPKPGIEEEESIVTDLEHRDAEIGDMDDLLLKETGEPDVISLKPRKASKL
eukprot:s1205_g18.t1